MAYISILAIILALLACVLKAISIAICSPADRKMEKEVNSFSKSLRSTKD